MFKSEITKNILVFTDLDGTLLDHHNYSFDAALEVLK
jgi:predicted mannosyl-3-phosphoglycerate phosphatase (HAD superfamily)